MPGVDELDTLRTLLRTARWLTAQIADEPGVRRLLDIFFRIPGDDRQQILDILEREVELQLVSRGPGITTAPHGLVVNPRARLYVRVHEREAEPPALPRDLLIVNTMRAARIIALSPGEHHDWTDATLEAFRMLDDGERAAVAELSREVLALLEQTTAPAGVGPAKVPADRVS